MRTLREVRAISLFSGVGGFDLGFQRGGIQTVLQAESDPQCLAVLTRHFPDVERVSDVRSVRANRGWLVDGAGAEPTGSARWNGKRIDLVYGGFPCQDLSVAGKRAGLSAERSGLWFEFHRVLSELRPTWAVIENVPGLLSSNSGRDCATLLGGLEELGYGWAYRILDAQWFGVPQRRRRVFVVGCLGDPNRAAAVLAVCEGCAGDSPPGREAGEGAAYSLSASARGTGDGHGNAWNSNYIADDEAFGTLVGRYGKGWNNPGRLVSASAVRASDGHHGHSSPRGDGADNLIAATLTDNNTRKQNGRGTYANGVRRLTPLECERLQGFPDGWTDGLSDSHRYRMMGNAVCVPVAEWIGHRLTVVDAL